MAEVMVINPRRRRGRRRKKSTHRRARATRRRRAVATNPVRRRRRSGKRRTAHRRHRRHGIARNPRLGSFLGVNVGTAAGTAIGIIGANLATAAVLNNVPGIPATFKSGPAKIAAKAVVGVAAGLLVKKVLKQQNLGNGIMAGGIIAALLEAYAQYVEPGLPATLKDYEIAGVGEYQLGDGDDGNVEEAITGFSGGENMYTDTMY